MSGVAASKKAKQDKKDAKEMTLEGAKFGAMQSEFDAGQDYYYNQLNRQNKQRGLAEFRKFSTVGNFAPTYTQDNAGIVMPDKPDAEEAFKAPEAEASSSKKKSTLEKIDPLGSKILGGLF